MAPVCATAFVILFNLVWVHNGLILSSSKLGDIFSVEDKLFCSFFKFKILRKCSWASDDHCPLCPCYSTCIWQMNSRFTLLNHRKSAFFFQLLVQNQFHWIFMEHNKITCIKCPLLSLYLDFATAWLNLSLLVDNQNWGPNNREGYYKTYQVEIILDKQGTNELKKGQLSLIYYMCMQKKPMSSWCLKVNY